MFNAVDAVLSHCVDGCCKLPGLFPSSHRRLSRICSPFASNWNASSAFIYWNWFLFDDFLMHFDASVKSYFSVIRDALFFFHTKHNEDVFVSILYVVVSFDFLWICHMCGISLLLLTIFNRFCIHRCLRLHWISADFILSLLISRNLNI